MPAPVAEIVIGYVPAATVLAAAMFSVAELPVTFDGAVIARPLGAPAAVNASAPAYPLTRVMVAVAVALPPCWTLAVGEVVANEKLCAVLLKVAVIVPLVLIAKVHVMLVPEHSPPLQPANALPALGAAVSVTLVPFAKVAAHVPPQLMPVGLDVTVPVPVPFLAIVICGNDTTSVVPKRRSTRRCRSLGSRRGRILPWHSSSQ